VYRRNRIGPRTDPCGTPYRTADGVEQAADVRIRVEHGHTNMRRTSSAPARQDRKTFAAGSVACKT